MSKKSIMISSLLICMIFTIAGCSSGNNNDAEYQAFYEKDEHQGYLSVNKDYDYPESYVHGTWFWDDEVVSREEYYNNLNEATYNQTGSTFDEIDYMSKDKILNELK